MISRPFLTACVWFQTGPNIRVELNSVGARLQHRAAASPSTTLVYSQGCSNMNGADSMCNWACVAPYLCACGRKANHSAYISDAVATAKRADVVLLTIGDTVCQHKRSSRCSCL